MRMVDFTNDKRDDFDFSVVNFQYLSSIFRNPLHIAFCFTVDALCLGLLEIYSGFKVIESGIFFTETSDYL